MQLLGYSLDHIRDDAELVLRHAAGTGSLVPLPSATSTFPDQETLNKKNQNRVAEIPGGLLSGTVAGGQS